MTNCIFNMSHMSLKWGYFETGVYMGAPQERRLVLNDFKLGRLDVGKSLCSTTRTSAKKHISFMR